jgi:hypothetical protein
VRIVEKLLEEASAACGRVRAMARWSEGGVAGSNSPEKIRNGTSLEIG